MTVHDIRAFLAERTPQGMTLRGIVNAVNQAVDDIQSRAGKGRWWFWQKEGSLSFVDEYSTGTVSVTKGSASIIGSGVVWTPTLNGRKFTAGGTEIYTFTYVSTNSGTISPAYVSETDSALTYSIYQDVYDLPSDAVKIDAFFDETNQRYVQQREAMRTMGYSRLTSVSGDWTRIIAQWGVGSSDEPQAVVYPRPTSVAHVPILYYRRPTDVTGPSSTPDLPSWMHRTVALGALAKLSGDQKHEMDFRQHLDDRWRENSEIMGSVSIRLAGGGMLPGTAFAGMYPYMDEWYCYGQTVAEA